MKMTVGKRILMFFHWLLSLLIVAAFAVYLIAPDFILNYYNRLVDAIGFNKVKIIGIALLAIYAVIAIAHLVNIFKRTKRQDRGFITVDSSDSGKVRIAIAAIEQMVRQSVGNIDGITEMKIGIENLDDAIGINVNATIVNGSHVPTITMNMQRAIRQFVETNCGVAVRAVSITINAVTAQPEPKLRRRRGKGQDALPTAAPVAVEPEPSYARHEPVSEPEPQPAPEPQTMPEPVFEPSYTPEPEPVSDQEPEFVEVPTPVFEAPASEPREDAAEEYDFEKPYESQFAKDLADLKAREAEEAGEYGADAE